MILYLRRIVQNMKQQYNSPIISVMPSEKTDVITASIVDDSAKFSLNWVTFEE